MWGLGAGVRLWVCQSPVSTRYGIRGLSQMVWSWKGHSPASGDVYVFFSGDRKTMKALKWDGDGFLMYTKRLSQGRFQEDLKRQQEEAHALWVEYSKLSSTLDLGTYWPDRQDEKQGECDQLKRWYDYAHNKVNKSFRRLEDEKREAAAVAYFRFRHIYILAVMLRDIAAAIEAEATKPSQP